jgi:uncharacterized repeat protein (TIGR03833 family)
MNLSATPAPNMFRENILLGMEVDVILKKDQRTGKRTRGKVRFILTSKPFHTRGIKVMLDSRQVGRVQEIISSDKTIHES